MKKILLATILCINQIANAETAINKTDNVCLVNYYGVMIHAEKILSVEVGLIADTKYVNSIIDVNSKNLDFSIKDNFIYKNYNGILINMTNQLPYTIKTDNIEEAEKEKVQLLNLIKDTCQS